MFDSSCSAYYNKNKLAIFQKTGSIYYHENLTRLKHMGTFDDSSKYYHLTMALIARERKCKHQVVVCVKR